LGFWGLGFGVLGLGFWPHPPIPNPQSPIPNPHFFLIKNNTKIHIILNIKLIMINLNYYKLLKNYSNKFALIILFLIGKSKPSKE
jgi:hypothetical protein